MNTSYALVSSEAGLRAARVARSHVEYKPAYPQKIIATSVLCLYLLVMWMLFGTNEVEAQTTGPTWDLQFSAYGVDGGIYAAARDADGLLYLGGEFSRAGGLAADGIVVWDGERWQALGGSLGNGFSGAVHAIAIDNDGDVYIGGDFGEVVQENGNVVEAQNVARWNGSAWEALGTGVDGPVHALAVQGDGTLYIGGSFGRDGSGEFELSKIASWDGSNLSSVGNGLGTFSGVVVRDLDFDSQGDLYAAGSELSGGIFKWDGQSWESIGASHQGSINAIAFDGADNLYAGGDFQSVIQPDQSELPANRVARWNGTAWEALGSGFGGEVRDIGFDAGGIFYASGAFAQLGDGAPMYNLAKWTTTWEAVGANTAENLFESLNALVFTGGDRFYALGDVQFMGGTLVNGVGYWDGQEWQGTGGMGLDANVRALAFDASGILYAGGSFSYAGASNYEKLVRWVDHAWEPIGQGIEGNDVRSILPVAGGGVYIAGDFSSVTQPDGTGLIAYSFASWDGTAWDTFGTGVNGTVNTMVMDTNGNLFIGGSFTQDGSGQETRNYIAMWDGTDWTVPAGGMDGPVHALTLDTQGRVVAGGAFTQAGSVANTAHLAVFDGTNWAPVSETTALDAEVNALYLDGAGRLFAGGAFTQVEDGLSANYIAIWENDAWGLLGSANGNGVSGCCVTAIAQGMGDEVAVAGDFEGVNNPVGPDLQAGHVALWRPQAGWGLLTSGVDGTVYALASNGEDIILGGAFQEAGGFPSARIARWSANELLVSVEDEGSLPAALATSEIYPNPAMQQAQLNLQVQEAQQVKVEIFDVLGRRVALAYSGQVAAFQQKTIVLERAGRTAGLYFVRITGERFTETRPITWIK